MRSIPEQSALRRCISAGAAWLALICAAPGLVVPNGVWLLAVLGVALWGAGASRPGRAAFWIEWLCASVGWGVICGWAWYVWPGAAVIIGVGLGAYFAFAGVLLRRIATAAPMAFAVPAAWIGVDALRMLLEPPFGFGWMRLGVHLHATEGLVGAARVCGVDGLGWVIAALAGWTLDVVQSFTERGEHALRSLIWPTLLGIGPLLAAFILSLAFEAPATTIGPRVLLVQPGVPQARKMEVKTRGDLFRDSAELTARALGEARGSGAPEPDLVAWGETMLGIAIVDPELETALARGVRADDWAHLDFDRETVERCLDVEENFVDQGLFGKSRASGVFAPGTNFIAGAEFFTVQDERIRRENAVFLWNASGERSAPALKSHLVPGAETMLGLERFGFVRDAISKVAGYVPDLAAGERTGVFELATRSGAKYRMSATVCFDNAFDGPYTSALRDGPVDFHLVVSNEAWYLKSQEVDQMIAFSRLIAVSTGRSVVRATNSGISALIGPDGREIRRLVVGGEDREVAGTLAVDVPVPVRGTEPAAPPPYVVLEHGWNALWLAVPLLALARAAWIGRGERRARAALASATDA